MSSSISICVIYPDLLGTYGDGGNAIVLAQRLRWRGIKAETKLVDLGEDVPAGCDIYLLGGGEDQPQVSVTERLAETRVLHKAVDAGAVVFGVCAGMQILGKQFPGADYKLRPGLGLIDIETQRGDGPRRVGELATRGEINGAAVDYTGYENHQGITFLGSEARPLAQVVSGIGNEDGKGTEGAVQGRIITTYMHGPALVRNANLADQLLEMATGSALEPVNDVEVDELRRERFAAAHGRKHADSTQGAGIGVIGDLRRRVKRR